LKANAPADELLKSETGQDYAKTVDCTAALNDQIEGKGDALTRVVMRHVSALGMMGMKELDLHDRCSDDPEKLHATERKMWTSFAVDVPKRTIGSYSASMVGRPLIAYDVNPYAAFGVRWANGAAVNYGAKEAMDYTTAYFSSPATGEGKKKQRCCRFPNTGCGEFS
jgi:hypothetical protein